MKILVISVFSNHMFNWILQLKHSGHEVHWLDVNDANTFVERIDFVSQTVKWKRIFDYPGRYWIKNNIPKLDTLIESFNQRKFIEIFRKKFNKIKPDVIHSFEMQTSCVPIINFMNMRPEVKWIYSPWGTDLFYYQNDPEKLKGIKAVFERLDYMFSDCKRDFLIAEQLGFKGKYLGTFPGGGGYDLDYTNTFLEKIEERNVILIKGYQHKYGRSIKILEALLKIPKEIEKYRIVIFATTPAALEFIEENDLKNRLNVEVKGKIGRGEVLELMGKSLIYIGNSISDGMPNTLLEAIIMESFPIQSNPGGATAEIIEHRKNGLLIENPEDSDEIATLIKMALTNPALVATAITYNTKFLKPMLDRNFVQKEVLLKYEMVEKNFYNS